MSKQATVRVRITRGALVAAFVVAGCTGSSAPAGPGPGAQQEGAAIDVQPVSAQVGLGASQQFAATVTGVVDTSVSWNVVEANCGSVTPAGLYTASGSVAICHVRVTSNADTTKAATAAISVVDPSVAGTWEPLKIGAGGWVTGIDACKTGATFVIRCDSFGAYISDGSGPWTLLTRADTMPASFIAQMGDWLGSGAYEIRVAPSDCNRLYMMFWNHLYVSTNRGASWTQTSFSGGLFNPNDGSFRYVGAHMAVDPANPDVVYAGTPTGGLFVSTNGGTTWSAVAGVPIPTTGAGITGLAFDESSGTTAGRTNTIYAVSNGNGVYGSTDAGTTWALLAGGPSSVRRAAVSSEGVYYATANPMQTSLYRYANPGNPGGLPVGWSTSAAAPNNLHSVMPDPFDASRVVAGYDGGPLYQSLTRGNSWVAGSHQQTRTSPAGDIPWLANAYEAWMSSGDQMFDPTVRNKLWFVEGIGAWYTNDAYNATTTSWVSHSMGIEQLVGRDIAVPPGSANVFVAGSDRSVWVVPRANTSYPTDYVKMGAPSSATLISGNALAYSRANPNHVVALINRGYYGGEPEASGYSLDNGATWTRFPVQPGSGGSSGCIVAPSIDNIIAVVGNRYAYRSTDRGASWTPLSLPGDSGANSSNLHGGIYNKKFILAVDGVAANTIYLYFYTRGIYRSTDGGATWALASSQVFDGTTGLWHTKLTAVPGQAGHLFLTTGQSGGLGEAHPKGTHLWRSTDGGSTWTTVPGIAEAWDVALGAAAPGHGYPTIYVAGWFNNVYGIWRSVDNAATWTQLGPFPFTKFDEITRLAAAQDVYGELYAAFAGSGWAKLNPPP